MSTKFLALAAIVLAGGGCQSQVPSAASFPHSYQKTVKASQHWQIIADDTAGQAVDSIQKQAITAPVHIAPNAARSSTFSQAFREFLTTSLVNKGVAVSTAESGPLEIKVETRVIRQKSDRTAHAPGAFTLLTAGIWVLRNAIADSWSGGTVSGLLLGGAIATDTFNAKGVNHPLGSAPTHTELIVTTSVTNKGQYVMRRSDVYYIEDIDGSLYRQALEWKVVG